MLMLKNLPHSSKLLHINSENLAKRNVVDLIPEMKMVFQGHWRGVVTTLMITDYGFEEDLKVSHSCQWK